MKTLFLSCIRMNTDRMSMVTTTSTAEKAGVIMIPEHLTGSSIARYTMPPMWRFK